jgi:hypothetical protein
MPLTDVEKTLADDERKRLPAPTTENGRYKRISRSKQDGLHSIERQEYYGTQGVGYEDIVTVERRGETWQFRKHVGPEQWRNALSGVWKNLQREPQDVLPENLRITAAAPGTRIIPVEEGNLIDVPMMAHRYMGGEHETIHPYVVEFRGWPAAVVRFIYRVGDWIASPFRSGEG